MKTTLNITGMSCENCVRFVTQALTGVPGVQSAKVSLAENRAIVEHGDADTSELINELIAAVQEEGYEAQLAA